jgi:hypothetical protein
MAHQNLSNFSKQLSFAQLPNGMTWLANAADSKSAAHQMKIGWKPIRFASQLDSSSFHLMSIRMEFGCVRRFANRFIHSTVVARNETSQNFDVHSNHLATCLN